MNKKKLLHSKWTALCPENKEKHFLVTSVHSTKNDPQVTEFIIIESVLTKRKQQLKPKDLGNKDLWCEGWH